MAALDSNEVARLFAELGILLVAGRVAGEMARAHKQPAVLGEIAAGVLLGPTFLSRLFPGLHGLLFVPEGPAATILMGLGQVAVALLLLVAGMHVPLNMLYRQGRTAVAVFAAGIFVPFVLGGGAALLLPELLARGPGVDPKLFALFFATALSISAMAVIARTLMDLGLYRSDLGMTIMAAAVCEDFVGWGIFAIVVSLVDHEQHGLPLHVTMVLTIVFAGFVLFWGRRAIDYCLPWLQAHSSWPGGVLSATFALAFLGAAVTAALGIHAVFGAFLVGVALGDSRHLRAQTRASVEQLVTSLLAPIFFAGVALHIDFIAHFNVPMVALVVLLASAGKIVGCGLGAMLSGTPARQSLAIGFGMNARGSMEIILGSLGLSYGIIGTELFVALVTMTVFTAGLSGPAMQLALGRKQGTPFYALMEERSWIPALAATSSHKAIEELCACLAEQALLPASHLSTAVWARERMMPTGLPHGLAMPHARLIGLTQPLLAVGRSHVGIDFDAPDGLKAQLIFMLLTPVGQEAEQLQLMAEMATTFNQAQLIQAARQANGFTEFLALARTKELKMDPSPL